MAQTYPIINVATVWQDRQYIYDPNTLSWIPWNGSLSTGALTIGTVNQGTAGTSPWLVDAAKYIFELDYVGGTNPIYVGLAAAGTATSAASWQIRKLTYDGNSNPTAILYANGTTAFSAIYDNRAALAYS